MSYLFQYTNRGFEISIIYRNKVLFFEPSFNRFRDSLIKIYDRMIQAVFTIPKLETKLYMDYEGDPVYLKVNIYLDALTLLIIIVL